MYFYIWNIWNHYSYEHIEYSLSENKDREYFFSTGLVARIFSTKKPNSCMMSLTHCIKYQIMVISWSIINITITVLWKNYILESLIWDIVYQATKGNENLWLRYNQERYQRSCRGVAEGKAFFHLPRLRSAGGFISVGDPYWDEPFAGSEIW